MGSPKSQILNGLNLPKGGFNLNLSQKPIIPAIDEDNSRVNLLALLKQLNQRKQSEEAQNLNLLNNLVQKSDRKISMWKQPLYSTSIWVSTLIPKILYQTHYIKPY